MRITAWICLGVLIFVIVALLLYLLIGAIIFKFAFSRKNLNERTLGKDIDKKIKQYNVDLCWFDKHKMQDVTIESFDNLKLYGKYLPANSNKSVIIVHGFGGSIEYMQQYCKFFYEKNFNILAVDCRAHGRSEGKCITFGWLDRLDVLAWVNFLNEKTPDNKILLFGLSMGGATVCMAAGEKMKNVVGIIADCAFDNADRQIDHILQRKHFIFKKILKKHLYSYSKRVHGFDCMLADAIKQVKKTSVPILYIHGDADDYVPIENMNNLYNATPVNLREKYVVEGAGHALCYPVAGVMYEKRIAEFIKSRTPLN